MLQAQVEGLNEALGETVRSHRQQRGGGGDGDGRQRQGNEGRGGGAEGEGEGEEQYESDFEDAESDGSGEERSGDDGEWGSGQATSGPGAQLLGMTQGPMDRTGGGAGAQREARAGSVTLRPGQDIPLGEAAAAAAGGLGAGALQGLDRSLDEALLTAGLPRAGLGFGAGGGFMAHGPALTTTDTVADGTGSGGSIGVVPVGGSLLSGVQQAVPALAERSSGGGGGRKLMPLAGYSGGLPLVKPPSFTFAPPAVTAAAGRGRPLAAFSDSYLSTSQISLHETLTNRAAFLRGELMEQLGGEGRLRTACDAVRALHRATGSGDGGDAVSDGELRETLCGAVSAAHLELAPLLDELVLLQARFYDAAAL